MGVIAPPGEDALVQVHEYGVLGLELPIEHALHVAMGAWGQIQTLSTRFSQEAILFIIIDV